MICLPYEIALDVQARLQARKFPLAVTYGPERTTREHYGMTITIERDREQGDSVDVHRGVSKNPRRRRQRGMGCKATLYASSGLPGARVTDHEALCDELVDAFLVALDEACVSAKAHLPDIIESGYAAPDERGDVETWPGVAYVVRFRVARGVYARTYEGQKRPEETVGGFTNSTEVRLVTSNAAPEDGC